MTHLQLSVNVSAELSPLGCKVQLLLQEHLSCREGGCHCPQCWAHQTSPHLLSQEVGTSNLRHLVMLCDTHHLLYCLSIMHLHFLMETLAQHAPDLVAPTFL